jgi:hypothetical protein
MPIAVAKESSWYSSYENGGLCPKAAKIAGCTKLARIIYSMMTNAVCYSE